MTAAVLPALSDRIARVLALDPSANALEFERTWHTWAELGKTADAISQLVTPGERVAVLLRNRPEPPPTGDPAHDPFTSPLER